MFNEFYVYALKCKGLLQFHIWLTFQLNLHVCHFSFTAVFTPEPDTYTYKLECDPSTQKYLMIIKSEMSFKDCSVNIA